MIEFFNEEIDFPDINEEEIISVLKEIIDSNHQILDYINIIFCSDSYLLSINQNFLSHDYYTDIITFHYSEEKIASDIYISIDRVNENARKENVSFINELSRIMIHGVLHLVGFDDKEPEAKKEMTSQENFYIEKMNV